MLRSRFEVWYNGVPWDLLYLIMVLNMASSARAYRREPCGHDAHHTPQAQRELKQGNEVFS